MPKVKFKITSDMTFHVNGVSYDKDRGDIELDLDDAVIAMLKDQEAIGFVAFADTDTKKPDEKAAPKTEAKVEAKIEAKTETKVEPKIEVKTEAKVEAADKASKK